PYQVAPDGRKCSQSPLARYVAGLWHPAAQVIEKLRPGVLPGTHEYVIGVRRGLIGKRRDMEATQHHPGSAPAIVVGDFVGPSGRCDVDLDHDQLGLIVQLKLFDVLVTNGDVILIAQVGGKRGQTQRWEQRVLDRSEQRARGLGEGRQDHLDPHWTGASALSMLLLT